MDLNQFGKAWFEDVWNRRMADVIDERMAPECFGPMEGAHISNREGFKEARAFLLDLFPDLHVVVEDTVADGENVVVRWNATGTHRGNGLGFAATNTETSFRGMTWLKVREGRIVQGWDSWNQGALVEQLRQRALQAVS
jgi:steroid delta-isomerase-like uncharacterized protein